MTRFDNDLPDHLAWLAKRFELGDRVRASAHLTYGTGEEIEEGTIGKVTDKRVAGCDPLVRVLWDSCPDELTTTVEFLEAVPS